MPSGFGRRLLGQPFADATLKFTRCDGDRFVRSQADECPNVNRIGGEFEELDAVWVDQTSKYFGGELGQYIVAFSSVSSPAEVDAVALGEGQFAGLIRLNEHEVTDWSRGFYRCRGSTSPAGLPGWIVRFRTT